MGMDDEWVMQQHYMYIVLLHHPSAIPLNSPFTFQPPTASQNLPGAPRCRREWPMADAGRAHALHRPFLHRPWIVHLNNHPIQHPAVNTTSFRRTGFLFT